MLLAMLLTPIFGLILGAISFLPDMSSIDYVAESAGLIHAIAAIGFVIFPQNLFIATIACVVFWLGVQVAWAIIEWIYKKIPGVN
jgi:hypothetical protein